MRKTHFVLSFCFLLVATGSALAQRVDVDWDHSADFSMYRTYAWMESKNPAPDIWDQRIVQDIDLQLTAKGLQKAETGQQPDLFVVYNADVKQQTSLEGYDYDFGPGWRWGGGGPVELRPVTENVGTLTVDLVDAQKKHLIWRGTATEVLSDKSEKNIHKVEKATSKMFEKYPPRE